MMRDPAPDERGRLVLVGIDGSNPLGFLAALGTLRTLTLARPDRNVKMVWTRHAGAWRPALTADDVLDEAGVIADLDAQLKSMVNHPALSVADDLTLTRNEFRAFADQMTLAAHSAPGNENRIGADLQRLSPPTRYWSETPTSSSTLRYGPCVVPATSTSWGSCDGSWNIRTRII